jgi:hypothetical protein
MSVDTVLTKTRLQWRGRCLARRPSPDARRVGLRALALSMVVVAGCRGSNEGDAKGEQTATTRAALTSTDGGIRSATYFAPGQPLIPGLPQRPTVAVGTVPSSVALQLNASGAVAAPPVGPPANVDPQTHRPP